MLHLGVSSMGLVLHPAVCLPCRRLGCPSATAMSKMRRQSVLLLKSVLTGSMIHLQEADLPTCCYHGDVPLDGRKEAIAQFAAGDSGEGEQPVMVCTDLAAR